MWSLNGLRGTPVPKAAGQDTPNVSDKFPSSPALVESCALKICCRSSRVSWTLAMQMTVGSLNPGFASYFPAVSSTTHRESESFLIIFFGEVGILEANQDWFEWGSCSAKCGGGHQSRMRVVANLRDPGGEGCYFSLAEDRACIEQQCEEACEWGDWQEWTECSKTCGGGTARRNRVLISIPTAGGKVCDDNSLSEAALTSRGQFSVCVFDKLRTISHLCYPLLILLF